MSRLGGMMRTTRPKKLTSKQPVPIYREDQIDLAEDDPQNTLQAVETGVEKAEETVSVIFLPNPPMLRVFLSRDQMWRIS
jgi:hypothetical protein